MCLVLIESLFLIIWRSDWMVLSWYMFEYLELSSFDFIMEFLFGDLGLEVM
jgi:hypothetical protein